MTIAFFNYLSSNLSRKIKDCKNIDEVIDVCVGNIYEFHSLMKLSRNSRVCHLEKCQIKLFCDSLSKCLKNNVRRSNHLLRRKVFSLSLLYPAGFRDCIFILKLAIVTVFPTK